MDNKKDEELFKNRLLELSEKSFRQNIYTFTDFLTMDQLSIASSMPQLRGAGVTAWGGAEICARKMLRFGDEEAFGYAVPFPIDIIKISPLNSKFADELSHRDFLGAVMNLGLKRPVIGDILVKDECAYLFAEQQVTKFIQESLCTVRHTSVSCAVINSDDTDELLNIDPKYDRKTLTVASLRLDAVIAGVYNLSRTAAADTIRLQNVYINQRMTDNQAASVKVGDIISVRGRGRFVLAEEGHVTRKGRLSITVDRYV